MKKDKEEIGLLLWQELKEPIMEKVRGHVDESDNLTIHEIINLDFVHKADRSNFVRSVYEGENIPDENPKIASDAQISFIILNDRAPEYEWATTGSGKRVYLNVNSANLKKYVRDSGWHWKYLHSTDDHDQFMDICALCGEAEKNGSLKIHREE